MPWRAPGVRSSGGAGRPPRGPGRPLPTPGGSPAGARPGADRPPAACPPAHGSRARGPGSLGSRHLFPALLAAAAAAAATGRRVRASEHALRGHARGGRTGGARRDPPGPAPEVTGTRGYCSAHGWLPVTPEARAGAGPPRSPPALPQRTHPGTGARAPGHPGAPASCTVRAPAAVARTVTLQTARQSTSSRALSPSLRDASLCHMSLGTLPNTPTHAHSYVPAPIGRAGRKPAVAGTLAFTDTR